MAKLRFRPFFFYFILHSGTVFDISFYMKMKPRKLVWDFGFCV